MDKINVTGIPLEEIWNYGGPLMWVLAALSVLTLAWLLYILISQRRGAIAPISQVSDIAKAIESGQADEAYRLAGRRPTAFGRLVMAALVARSHSTDAAKISAAIEAEGSHIASRLNGAVDYLADIAALAPLVGLLGTVLGMFQTFHGISSGLQVNVRFQVLSAGVSQAIITTVFGLVVAIPALALYALLRRRTQRRIDQLESLAVDLERVLT
ncbi:MAG: MotA/TolQ/ExbB proton channel family protein [Kiritimatiellae bacterium]|nr:MotA/TolQ/ExbB proton channel family protein [Kiritimatiellia bacterium]